MCCWWPGYPAPDLCRLPADGELYTLRSLCACCCRPVFRCLYENLLWMFCVVCTFCYFI